VVAVDAQGNASGPSDLVSLPRPFVYSAAPPEAKVRRAYRYRPAATFSMGHLTCRNGYNAAFWQRETLTWTLLSGPAWLRLKDGELAGTPTAKDVGVHLVSLKVENDTGSAAEQSFQVTVSK